MRAYATPFAVEIDSRGRLPMVRCSGSFVLGENTAALAAAVESVIGRSRFCLVDLSAVTRIDAHGIGQLMQLLDTAHKLTGAIKALGTTGEAGQLDSGGDPLSVPPIVKCLPQVHCSGACC